MRFYDAIALPSVDEMPRKIYHFKYM